MVNARRRRLESTLVALLLLAAYLAGIRSTEFYPDESQWIATSFVFEKFVTLRFSSPAWDESYWTLTQPPLARYVIGLGRRLGGHKEVNLPWRFYDEDDMARNVAEGRYPSPSLLCWSRLPMAFLAVLSVYLGFALLREVAGSLAGCVWVGLCLVSSYLTRTLCRAMSEAPLLLAVLAATWAGYRWLDALGDCCGPQRWGTEYAMQARRRGALWFVAMGSLAGAAAAAKLNGLAALPAGALLCVGTWRRHGSRALTHELAPAVCAVLLMIVALLVFVALNPYLYPDPLGRSLKMLRHRTLEMAAQLRDYPDSRMPAGTARVLRVAERVFAKHAALPQAPALNVLLSLIGLAVLLRQSRLWLNGGAVTSAALPVGAVLGGTAASSLLTPLDWDRYFLLPVVFSMLCIAVGAARCFGALWDWAVGQSVGRRAGASAGGSAERRMRESLSHSAGCRSIAAICVQRGNA